MATGARGLYDVALHRLINDSKAHMTLEQAGIIDGLDLWYTSGYDPATGSFNLC